MIIVLTGAGSGGHITPILAVAKELKRQQPKAKLIYIGQAGDKLGDIPAHDPNIDQVFTVRAGKFRRYHGEGIMQVLDLATLFKNIRDFFYVLIGLVQSRRLLKNLQPNIIFIKGGFVGVPVGLVAAQLKIPYITHDSDAVPGLANRIISRWAKLHTVALPEEVYNYPSNKTVTTGIPLQSDFEPVSDKLKQKYREELKIPANAKVLFIIGGGLGSKNINDAVADAVPHLLSEFSDLWVIHATGRANQSDVSQQYASKLSELEQKRLKIRDYIDDVYRYSGAADIVITRAGATNLAEFALQAKACVVIPSPFLAGGHQLKNAEYLAKRQAALVIDEKQLTDDPHRLAKQVSDLLKTPERRTTLAKELSHFAKPEATNELAQLILEQVKK